MIDNKTFIIGGIIIALIIGVAAVFLASGDPDGLESTALVVQGQKTITGTRRLARRSMSPQRAGSRTSPRCPTTRWARRWDRWEESLP